MNLKHSIALLAATLPAEELRALVAGSATLSAEAAEGSKRAAPESARAASRAFAPIVTSRQSPSSRGRLARMRPS